MKLNKNKLIEISQQGLLYLCLTSVVVLTPLISSPVFAESSTKEAIQFNVSAGDLGRALNNFAQQAGIAISFNPEQVKGITTDGLQGDYIIAQGFQRLLQDSNLAYEKTSSGYTLRQSTRKETDEHALGLDPIQVIGSQVETATSAVDGYVAKRSATATKTDTPLLETAQSISVVSAENIADRKVNTVEEAVAYVSGVRIGDSGLDPRFDQIYIRGFEATTNADFLDGLRQPNTGWLSYFSSEPYNLERIEILKGPASVLYGQISPGGMVNRVTKRADGKERGEVQFQLGSHNHYQGQFDVAGKFSGTDDISYRLVGLLRDSETEYEGVDNDTRFIAPSLLWNLSEQSSLTLLAQYQDRLTSGSPKPYQDDNGLTYFWAGDEEFDKLDQQQFTFGYELDHKINERFSFQHHVRYGDVDTINQYADVSGTTDGHTLDRDSFGVYENMQSLTSDARIVASFGSDSFQHKVLAGFDYSRMKYDVDYRYGIAPSIDIFNPDYNQSIVYPEFALVTIEGESRMSGIYLQDQIKLNAWRLSAGLRRDWVETEEEDLLYGGGITETKNNKTSGQVGALYLFDSGWAPYASYAQSFLPQTGSDASGAVFKPTEGKQFELGVKFQPTQSSTLFTASIYHLVQSNVLTTDPANTLFSVQTGEQRSRGLELELVSNVSEQLKLTTSYSFNDAEITKSNDNNLGKQPNNIPRQLASFWADYTFMTDELSGLGISAGIRWVGSSYDDAENTLKNDNYTLIDFAAHYDFSKQKNNGLRLALNVSNVFDERYINCADSYCYRGAERNVIGSISYRW